jgi:hypothetical protein
MTTKRECGDCQLCCRLLPTEEIGKPAGRRCQHQKHGVGCAIYAERPASCQLWSCRWLTNDDGETADLPRPDRAHYVIDMMPDFVTATGDDGEHNIPVVQVWVDRGYPNAHRSPSFRAWLDRQEIPAVIRYDRREGFVLFPPSITGGRGWIEHRSSVVGREHSLEQKAAVLGDLGIGLEIEHDGNVYKGTIRIGGKSITVAAMQDARDHGILDDGRKA